MQAILERDRDLPQRERISFGGRAVAAKQAFIEIADCVPRLLRINHYPAQAIRRCAGHGEQCGGNKSAGRRFGDRNRLFSRLQRCRYASGLVNKVVHSAILRMEEQ
jgi:hypothetical protein